MQDEENYPVLKDWLVNYWSHALYANISCGLAKDDKARRALKELHDLVFSPDREAIQKFVETVRREARMLAAKNDQASINGERCPGWSETD